MDPQHLQDRDLLTFLRTEKAAPASEFRQLILDQVKNGEREQNFEKDLEAEIRVVHVQRDGLE